MSTKKKIIISFSTICVALVIALVTIISVFAASSQGTTAQIAVTYKATNVSAKISGDYMLEGDADYTSMGETVEFEPRDNSTTKNLNVNGIDLTGTKTYVLFRYTIENVSDTANIKISNNVVKDAESYNVRAASAYSTEEITEHFNLISSTNLEGAILTGGGRSYVYVKIDVNNAANDASFHGKINFNLEYTTETEATETLGIAKVGDIVERGEYPQSFVGAELNSTLVNMKDSLQATGHTFTTDINGTTTVCKEYLYNNERYVMLEDSRFCIYGAKNFSTGETIGSSGQIFNDGATVFFKVEPIKFQVMAIDEGNDTITLWSTMLLGSMWFDEESNEWQNSDIRTYLNDKFLKDSDLGYTPKQIQIKNNIPGEYDINNGIPTQDRLWLPAVTDLVEWYPDLNIELGSNTYEVLIKKPTDFTLATYEGSVYWLRSAGDGGLVCDVNHNRGDVHDYDDCYFADSGLCPAFVTDL